MEKIQFQQEEIQRLSNKFQVSYLCAKVLASKKLTDEEITSLLEKPVLNDPFDASGIKEVVDRIQTAKINNEKVMICGDYDSDGICATAILYDALTKYGVQSGFYIPNRFKEGYGLHPDTVQLAYQKGYRLLITVDNGVKAHDALAKAKSLGIDVIVTDHHTIEEKIDCLHLLHPKYMGEEYLSFCGADVALTIARALIGDCEEHIIYACIASIADVMVLRGETRKIVKLGIQYLNQGFAPSIQLLKNNKYNSWDETEIAFSVVPKLNATGRLADLANANNTVKYLLSQNLTAQKQMAVQINDLNETRKSMSASMVELARNLIDAHANFQVIYDENLHEGILGLIAGKLCDEYNQPVMILSKHHDLLKGSIRGGNRVDLRTFFDDIKDELSAYGGHRDAAGIAFPIEKLDEITTYVKKHINEVSLLEKEEETSIALSMDEINVEEVESLACLAPFGNGFEEPQFYLEEMKPLKYMYLKDGLHVKWVCRDDLECLLFQVKEGQKKLVDSEKLDFIGSLKISSFMGKKKMNLFVNELVKSDAFSENV